jgi:hypothetical protein
MNINRKLDLKRRVGLVLIAGLLMCTNTLYGQVINICEHKAEADVNVYYTKYKHEADIVVMMVGSKYQAWFGKWYVDRKPGKPLYGEQPTLFENLKVYTFKHDYHEDFI